jgi:folate-binding protein YgfZ
MARSHNVSLPGYAAALGGAAYYLISAAGFLRVAGPDRSAFLQRQTTNDVNLLAPGRTLNTVLTSPSARILDVFLLLPEPETIGLLTLPGNAPRTSQFLRSRIFFMDHVTVEDCSADYSQVELVGPAAMELLTSLGVEAVPGPGEVVGAALAGGSLLILGEPALANSGLGILDTRLSAQTYRLLLPVEAWEALSRGFQSAGAIALDEASYQALRVEAGQPAVGHELTEEYTPLESGMNTVISDDKGCYTGQEVIARQITYDKVTRQLAGLRLEAPAAPGESLRAMDEDRTVGEITSYADSPRFGPIALGIIRRPFHQPGARLRTGDGLQATVVALPFQEIS